jgi:hypothetical protein
MNEVAAGGGYRFDGVGTDQSELSVLWSLDGLPCPPLRVTVENCASSLGRARLQLHVPDELASSCPGLRPVAIELARAVALERPVGQLLTLPPWVVTPVVAFITLVVAAGLLIRRLLRPARGSPSHWGDIAWVAIVLALATPFFFNILPALTLELGIAWVVFAVLLCADDRPATAAQRGWLLVLFCFSLLVNWWLASGGPGELHLNLASIWSADIERRWGPAPIALFRVLGLVTGPIRDSGIVCCHLILGSLIPILLCAVAGELGVSNTAAWLAGLVVAAHPLLILSSGVLERQPTYLFAAVGSTLALVRFLKRGGGTQLVAFIVGAVLATATRPEGAHVGVLYLAALLLVPATLPARAAVIVALMFLLPLAYGYTHYGLELTPAGGYSDVGRTPFLWTILFDRDFTPSAWIVAWLAGLILGIRWRAAWVALLALIGFDLVWRWADVYRMFVFQEGAVSCARYQTILLVPFAIGVALFMQAMLATPTWLKAAVLAGFVTLTAATYPRSYDTLLRPFTVDYEYRFLKRHVVTLPSEARLYILDPPFDDLGFNDATQVGKFVGSSVRFGYWSERRCEDLRRDPSPAYLYIGSACAEVTETRDHPLRQSDYARWLQTCAAIRARVSVEPIEEIDVPARKMVWFPFKDGSVRLGLYRLRDPSLCELGPRLPDFHPDR